MRIASTMAEAPSTSTSAAVEAKAIPQLYATAIGIALLLMLVRVATVVALGGHLEAGAFLGAFLALSLTMLLLGGGFDRSASIAVCWCLYEIGAVALYDWTVDCFTVGRSFPMVDAGLASIDRAVGFDWPAYLAFVDRHATLNDFLLRPAYLSIFWQPAAAAIILPMLGRARDAFLLLLSFSAAIMICCIVAVFTPAYGAYHFYGIDPTTHPHVTDLVTGDGIAKALDWLRTEAPKGQRPPGQGGLITFPSFHTAGGILLVWAFRNTKVLRGPAIALNGAMLLATPLHGSHYLADMGAGAVLASAVIALLHRAIPCGSRAEGRGCRRRERSPIDR